MVLLKLLILTLTFYELIVDLDAKSCPKGMRVSRDGNSCENCLDEFYQPEENHSKHCIPCTKCDRESGSDVEEKCTKEMNRKCRCRGEFVPSDSDSSTCKCDIGFGLNRAGSLPECAKCETGYFSSSIDSTCRKWKECKSAGVNFTGSNTADAICNELKSNTYITTPPTSNKMSLIVRLTSHRPHEGAHTQKLHTTTITTTTTTSGPGHTITPKVPVQPFQPSNTGNHIGMALLIFGIIGLLVLTAVTCKLHIASCVPIKPAVQTRESLCRRPVEESGNGSLSSLKLNPEEPSALFHQ
ncbi:tumor necrosis factor receptor superfamily member 4 [Enoplosus armatus]|uniref:tumor necrosis factor receptor superfamily member 4 n=1 Tax=Enoplosus armatus TaxID=215367 RepID=UPI003996165E